MAHTTWQLVPDMVANVHIILIYITDMHIYSRQQSQAAQLLHLVLFTAVQQYCAAALGKADSDAIAARKQLRKQVQTSP